MVSFSGRRPGHPFYYGLRVVAASRSLRARYLLVENIKALLSARRVDQRDLAQWAGHRGAWISKILSGDRGVQLGDLDKIADFFGLTVADLFSVGIARVTERRRRQRRAGTDRRSGLERRVKRVE